MDHNHTKHCKISKFHQLFKTLVWDRRGERKGILSIWNKSNWVNPKSSHWGHCHSNWISRSLTSNSECPGAIFLIASGRPGLIRSGLVTPAVIIWTWPVIKVRYGHIVNTPDQQENMANMLIWCQVITTFWNLKSVKRSKKHVPKWFSFKCLHLSLRKMFTVSFEGQFEPGHQTPTGPKRP